MAKRISLDNGITYMTAAEAVKYINKTPRRKVNETQQEKQRMLWWSKIISSMDEDLYHEVDEDVSPCTGEEFLAEYLDRAPHDLVIG